VIGTDSQYLFIVNGRGIT